MGNLGEIPVADWSCNSISLFQTGCVPPTTGPLLRMMRRRDLTNKKTKTKTIKKTKKYNISLFQRRDVVVPSAGPFLLLLFGGRSPLHGSVKERAEKEEKEKEREDKK